MTQLEFKSQRVKNARDEYGDPTKRYIVSSFQPILSCVEYDNYDRHWYAYLSVEEGKWKRYVNARFRNKREALELAKILLAAAIKEADRAKQAPSKDRFLEANNNMTFETAYKVLGLENGASEEQITQKHRELTKKCHPDAGGSTFLMVQVNLAKDVLSRRFALR